MMRKAWPYVRSAAVSWVLAAVGEPPGLSCWFSAAHHSCHSWRTGGANVGQARQALQIIEGVLQPTDLVPIQIGAGENTVGSHLPGQLPELHRVLPIGLDEGFDVLHGVGESALTVRCFRIPSRPLTRKYTA